MRVISNTSPITNLAATGRLDLLHVLYDQIIITGEVRDELVLGGDGNNPGADAVTTASWFHIEYVDPLARDQLARQFSALDLGEAATLALAIAQPPHLILLDDQAARHAAASLTLPYVGIVGVLLVAKARGLVPLVKPILDDLRVQAGFRLADRVYQEALRRAGE
jgi:uncharacterized protein